MSCTPATLLQLQEDWNSLSIATLCLDVKRLACVCRVWKFRSNKFAATSKKEAGAMSQ